MPSARKAGSTAALAAVLALFGCGGGARDVDARGLVSPSAVTTAGSSAVSSSPAPASTPTREVPRTGIASPGETSLQESDQILAQYRTFFAAITPVWMMPDPEARAGKMAQLAVDPEYTSLLSAMKASRDAGEVAYGDDVVHPQLQSVTGGEATLVDCQDTSPHGRMKMATGDKVTQGRKNDLAQVTMKKQGADGLWRVATVAYAAAGSCDTNG